MTGLVVIMHARCQWPGQCARSVRYLRGRVAIVTDVGGLTSRTDVGPRREPGSSSTHAGNVSHGRGHPDKVLSGSRSRVQLGRRGDVRHLDEVENVL